MIIWRDSAAEDRYFPTLLFVSVVLKEMMQAVKLVTIHPRRYRSQRAVFLLDLLHMDSTSQANFHMDPSQGLHLLEGAAEISYFQRKGGIIQALCAWFWKRKILLCFTSQLF